MPSKIIRDGAVVEDSWVVVDSDTGTLPEGKLIVPLSLWSENREQLSQRSPLGIWLDSHESPAQLAGDDIHHFDVIAINFPAFADGRGFSYARELRETHGYRGELRAIGAFMRDQLYFLNRCGFNAFALQSDELEAALQSFRDFSSCYQVAMDDARPLFKRS